MKDYNTITAELLKNAPHGIDCYVSNVSYEDALQDIHCTGDAIVRVACWVDEWIDGKPTFLDESLQPYQYVVPVHLVVNELVNGCIELYNKIDGYHDDKPRDVLLFDFIDKIG